MSPATPDHDLVSAYTVEGSEPAFRALVARHVDLVYATALRQVGNPALAEEITQNAFIVLARKAPRLRGHETIAGWLHRATILEARARVRAELRRQQREHKAAEFASLERDGASPLAALIPMVDEALLSLRDHDRLALILRFFEDRSLKEVGHALGVDEDAARKRVSRALDRVLDFFKGRGLVVPAGTGAAGVLTCSTQAAPASLALASANAAIAAGSVSTAGLATLYFMSLIKSPAIVACVLAAAVPLAWQWHAQASVEMEQSALDSRFRSSQKAADDASATLEKARADLLRMRDRISEGENRVATLTSQRDGQAPKPVDQCDDNSRFARVPKSMLAMMPISSVDGPRGQLTAQMKAALQMTESEAGYVQESIDRFLASYESIQARQMKEAKPTKEELNGRDEQNLRVYDLPNLSGQAKDLQLGLFREIAAELGDRRFEAFKAGLDDWMSVDDEIHGLSTGLKVLAAAHNVVFVAPSPGDKAIQFEMRDNKGSMVSMSVQTGDIASPFREKIADWIAIANQPAPAKK